MKIFVTLTSLLISSMVFAQEPPPAETFPAPDTPEVQEQPAAEAPPRSEAEAAAAEAAEVAGAQEATPAPVAPAEQVQPAQQAEEAPATASEATVQQQPSQEAPQTTSIRGQISGCTFAGQTLFRGSIPIASNWGHGFKVPGRSGSGILLKRIDPGGADEAYSGEFPIDEGVKLLVEVAGMETELRVDAAVVRELPNHSLEVIAEASGRGRTVSGANFISTSVRVLNPLVASILENEGQFRDPMQSAAFPSNVTVYSHVEVTCYSDLK